MKTIVDRLRQFPGGVGAEALCREAADEIERLRTALKQIADDPYTNADDNFSFASEALKRSPVETKSQVTVWGRPRWTVERPNDPCINCGCTRFICTGCIGASSEKATVRCTCFEDDHGPDCDIDGCCGQCTGQKAKPQCVICNDTGLVEYDDAHGEPRNAPCACGQNGRP